MTELINVRSFDESLKALNEAGFEKEFKFKNGLIITEGGIYNMKKVVCLKRIKISIESKNGETQRGILHGLMTADLKKGWLLDVTEKYQEFYKDYFG